MNSETIKRKRGRPKKVLNEVIVTSENKELKPNYQVILETRGVKYNGEAPTLFEAIDSLKLGWQQIKAKGVFTIIHDDKKCEKLFYLRPLKRIFVNKLTKQLWARNLERLLK